MEYGKIVNRSVNIVWDNKYLIVLGILAALSGTTFSGGGGGGGGNGGGQMGPMPSFGTEEALAVGIIIAIIIVAVIIGLIFWAIGTVARGGLVAGVDTIEEGGTSSFSQAWNAGWQKVWTLLGIGIVPAIPGLILFVFGVFAAIVGVLGYSLGLGDLINETGLGAGFGVLALLVLCIVVPIALVLTILRTFAERACMLENLGVIDSYRRGARVLTNNLGEAIVLFLLQIVIFIGLGILLFIPGFIAALCCFLWPLLILFQGAVTAFVSALWTLAWRTWTIGTPPAAKAPKAI
jgi:hypothetical protein